MVGGGVRLLLVVDPFGPLGPGRAPVPKSRYFQGQSISAHIRRALDTSIPQVQV